MELNVSLGQPDRVTIMPIYLPPIKHFVLIVNVVQFFPVGNTTKLVNGSQNGRLFCWDSLQGGMSAKHEDYDNLVKRIEIALKTKVSDPIYVTRHTNNTDLD